MVLAARRVAVGRQRGKGCGAADAGHRGAPGRPFDGRFAPHLAFAFGAGDTGKPSGHGLRPHRVAAQGWSDGGRVVSRTATVCPRSSAEEFFAESQPIVAAFVIGVVAAMGSDDLEIGVR